MILPPLLSLLYFIFSKSKKEQKTLNLFLTTLAILVFEAQNGYFFLSLLLYFIFLDYLIRPWISKLFSCHGCKIFVLVLFSYVGFYLFYMMVAQVFMIEEPDISFMVIYYIFVEFFIVGLLI